MVSFEIFVKAMPPSLSELKVLPSFCFAFKIPDDVTASSIYVSTSDDRFMTLTRPNYGIVAFSLKFPIFSASVSLITLRRNSYVFTSDLTALHACSEV